MLNKKIILVSILLFSSIFLTSCMDKNSDNITKSDNVEDEKIIPVESGNAIGDGAEQVDELSKKAILTDEKGMTLYIFKKDSKNISNCSGGCEKKWPVFFNDNLKENGYSSIKREDGKMQTTLNGQPLYYFFKDEKAGDMKGEGLKNVWYTIKK